MSKRVLLIKLTSMGDLVHALPAITDAARAIPGIQFDWVVDEAFAQIPHWHPAVNRVIHSAHRRWKKNLKQAFGSGELKNFYQQLNRDDYDIIIDGQNNLKSAVISGLRRGPCHGVDKHSLKEKPAHWAYRYQYSIDRSKHAIARQRELFANAIGYPAPDSPPDYGIDRNQFQLPDLDIPKRFLLFVHNASWSTKLWPENHWHALIQLANDENYQVLLPCGNDEELQRAQRLAAQHSNAIALPKLNLSEVAALLARAQGAVCCDTGLGHIAGLLDLPAISFYGPTSHRLVGATGLNQQHFIASEKEFPCAPCYGRRCTFEGNNSEAACMASFTPHNVWSALTTLIATGSS